MSSRAAEVYRGATTGDDADFVFLFVAEERPAARSTDPLRRDTRGEHAARSSFRNAPTATARTRSSAQPPPWHRDPRAGSAPSMAHRARRAAGCPPTPAGCSDSRPLPVPRSRRQARIGTPEAYHPLPVDDARCCNLLDALQDARAGRYARALSYRALDVEQIRPRSTRACSDTPRCASPTSALGSAANSSPS